MGRTTKIPWCDHTFNPWHGCVAVSPGCDHCYAETFDKRLGRAIWGKAELRWFPGPEVWAAARAWHRDAERTKIRRRVFCASMADVFEERDDLDPHRGKLWALIRDTPALDWLLLTKRAGALRRMLPSDIAALPNVWPGVSVESSAYTWRLDKLLQVECAGPRWASYEPALGPVNFRPYLGPDRIEWVIVGGESGPRSRPFDPAWAAGTIAACRASGAAPFVKQLGTVWAKTSGSRSYHGDKISDWPGGLQVREWPAIRRPAASRPLSASPTRRA
jgi:protein gp37